MWFSPRWRNKNKRSGQENQAAHLLSAGTRLPNNSNYAGFRLRSARSPSAAGCFAHNVDFKAELHIMVAFFEINEFDLIHLAADYPHFITGGNSDEL